MASLKNVTIYHILVAKERFIGLKFFPDKVLNALVKELPELQWSEEHHMHCIPNKKEFLEKAYATFKGVAWINGNHFYKHKKRESDAEVYLSIEGLKKACTTTRCPITFLEKLLLKGYAKSTCRSYISMFERFAAYFKDRTLDEISDRDIRDYLLVEKAKGLSFSFQNQMLNAIKFYYEIVLNMPNRFYHLERPKQEDRLPTVLSQAAIKRMIECPSNVKHRCMISLLYSSGLRRSELIKLEIGDVDSERMLIHVRSAKGKKDRMTSLSRVCLNDLRQYYLEWRPFKYLFEGPKGGPYSATSLNNIVKKAAKQAGIRKKVTCHTLRHSFATHLLENGTNLRVIQELLGHNSSKTTEIYTRVAKNTFRELKNPLDDLHSA